MADVKACDCCGAVGDVRPTSMTADGIGPPRPIPRQGGLVRSTAIDLCESCCVALVFKWEELRRRGGKNG